MFWLVPLRLELFEQLLFDELVDEPVVVRNLLDIFSLFFLMKVAAVALFYGNAAC